MPSGPSWKRAGLWHYFVKEHFLLVPMAHDRDTAQMILHEGDRQMRGVTRRWMDGVLDAASAAIEYACLRAANLRLPERQAGELLRDVTEILGPLDYPPAGGT